MCDQDLDFYSFPDIASRVAAYRAGRDAAADLAQLIAQIEARGLSPNWISLFATDEALKILARATARLNAGALLPLYGIPFAVKDNIDVAGLPTTAGCPDYTYMPAQSAHVVERLIEAGAIPIGKTNLDQFATGLNGTRSPYGAPASVFDSSRVSGGSSSGSAVAVGSLLVPFALGTDTAGSGRVPAAFNNIVGLKPTKGLLSTSGVVPACRSLDCVSIFATSIADAQLVASIAAGFDPADCFSRRAPEELWTVNAPPSFRFAVIGEDILARCSQAIAQRYRWAVETLESQGGVAVSFDYAPFEEAASLLYAGPWVAERFAAIREFAQRQPQSIHPVVRDIVLSADNYSAADAFIAQYRLAALIRQVEPVWETVDFLVLPTAPDHPTLAAMLGDPIGLNSRLGLFTNFVNLMDLAALALPSGLGEDGLPTGVTLVGPSFSDGMLAQIGDRLHRADALAVLGMSDIPLSTAAPLSLATTLEEPCVTIAVVGAHLSGQPLNHQLTSRKARFLGAARTARGYSLYALSNTAPAKPGLARDGGAGGIELELWSLDTEGFGSFVAEIPPPLGIGTLTLDDGRQVKGFLCEAHALAAATDITAHGGWRAYLASQDKAA